MREFGEALTNKLAEVRAIALITDQDFSNAEAAAKQFRETCDKLKLAKAQMLEQTVTIGEAASMIDAWHEDLRLTALKLEKDVTAEKEAKKLAIISAAKSEYADYINMLENEIKPIRLNLSSPDFAGAMKGKRLLSAWHDAVSAALANAKVEADMQALDYRGKLDSMRTVDEYKFLFLDLQQIIVNPRDYFDLLVTSRIDAYKAAESAKKEAERKAMQAEEEAKAKAKVESDNQAVIAAQVKVQLDAQQAALRESERLARNTDIEQQLIESIGKPVIVEAQKSAVIAHQDEIRAFFDHYDTPEDKRQMIRPYLVEFIKFKATQALKQAA
jgi:hypothetical protein